jgi:multisubunit Na+/H+ antiporter MnhB subunit
MLAKSARPRIPIALLVPVAFAPDWIEWVFDAAGHRNREISHSLVSVGIGATLVALAYFIATRQRVDAFAVWLTYVSHWPADFITGLKPTWPGGPTVGLFMYGRPYTEFVIEAVVIVSCWFAYRRSLPVAARDRRLGLLVPVGLIAMQLAFLAISDPSLRK